MSFCRSFRPSSRLFPFRSTLPMLFFLYRFPFTALLYIVFYLVRLVHPFVFDALLPTPFCLSRCAFISFFFLPLCFSFVLSFIPLLYICFAPGLVSLYIGLRLMCYFPLVFVHRVLLSLNALPSRLASSIEISFVSFCIG